MPNFSESYIFSWLNFNFSWNFWNSSNFSMFQKFSAPSAPNIGLFGRGSNKIFFRKSFHAGSAETFNFCLSLHSPLFLGLTSVFQVLVYLLVFTIDTFVTLRYTRRHASKPFKYRRRWLSALGRYLRFWAVLQPEMSLPG